MRHKFFIALLPSLAIQGEITDFKNYMASHHDSRKALNSPPHITLQPPFELTENEIPTLLKHLAAFAQQQTSFQVQLNNFGHFGDRVIFAKFIDEPILERLYTGMRAYMSTHFGFAKADDRYPFHPHITIAFRDLTPEQFPSAWAYFEEITYERVFEVNGLILLKHDGKCWDIFEEFLF